MELQQLRYVLAVAELRNFTRAAEREHVVQSALSHQVKALERELGVELFARTSRRVELTAAGAAFLPQARAALSTVERAATDARSASGIISGRLAVGTIPTATALDLPGAIADFGRRHPQVSVGLTVGNSGDLIGQIAAGEVDVALLGLSASTRPQGVATRELLRERLVAVMPEHHRLAGRTRLSLADLTDEAFGDFPAGGTGRAQSDEAFVRAGLTRTVSFELTSVDHLLSLVSHGLCVTLLAPSLVAVRDDLVTVPVSDGPERVQYLAWSDFNPSPATKAFLAEEFSS